MKLSSCKAPDRASCPRGCSDECTQAREVRVLAGRLVQLAEFGGQVLTIEQIPLQPLAMGNYETVVHVRPARGKA